MTETNEPQWKRKLEDADEQCRFARDSFDQGLRHLAHARDRVAEALNWTPPEPQPKKVSVWVFPALDQSVEEIVEFLRAVEPVCNMVYLSTGPQRIGTFYLNVIDARDAAGLSSVRIGAALSASGILGKDGSGFSCAARMRYLGQCIDKAYGQTGHRVIVDFETCNILQDGIDYDTMTALMKTWGDTPRIIYPSMANPSPSVFAKYKDWLRNCVEVGGDTQFVDHVSQEGPDTCDTESTREAKSALCGIAPVNSHHHGLLNLNRWGDKLPEVIAYVRRWRYGHPIVMINDFAATGGLADAARLKRIMGVG